MANNNDLRPEDAYSAFEMVGRVIFLALAKFFVGLAFGKGGTPPPQTQKTKELLTTKEARLMLKVGQTKFWQLAKDHDLGRIDIVGSHPKFDPVKIQAFIDSQKE